MGCVLTAAFGAARADMVEHRSWKRIVSLYPMIPADAAARRRRSAC